MASTVAPAGVSAQRSMPSGTPSLSLSSGQPVASTVAPAGVFAHLSSPSNTLSPSESVGQPRTSTVAPVGVLGQASFLSGTPSRSVSLGGRGGPFSWKSANPAENTMLVRRVDANDARDVGVM